MAIMSKIARSGQAFTVVDEKWFQDWVHFCNPRVRVKSSSNFSQFKLPLLYNSVMSCLKKVLQKDLSKCNQVALTTDCWTSRDEEPFIALTLHYINEAFELKKFMINFDNFNGQLTGCNIAEVNVSSSKKTIIPLELTTKFSSIIYHVLIYKNSKCFTIKMCKKILSRSSLESGLSLSNLIIKAD